MRSVTSPPAITPTVTTRAPALGAVYGLCGLTLPCVLGWVVLALAHPHAPDLPYDQTVVVGGFGVTLAGLFVLVHRSGHALGWLLLSAGFLSCLSRFAVFAMAVAGAGPAGSWLGAVVVLAADTLFLFTMYTLPLWVPGGRLPARWGRPYAGLIGLVSVVQTYYGYAVSPADWYGLSNPLTHGALARAVVAAAPTIDPWSLAVSVATVVGSLTVTVVRHVRGPAGHARDMVLLVPYLVWVGVDYAGAELGLSEQTVGLLLTVGGAVWPLGVAYGFVRDRSWYLERSGRRTITRFILVGMLTVGYLVLAYALPYLFHWTAPVDVAIARLLAFAALLVGLSLLPITMAVSQVVERLYFGRRAQPYQVARELATRLSQAVGLGDAPSVVCDTVTGTLGLPGARIVASTDNGQHQLAARGSGGGDEQAFPFTHDGAVIGYLYAAPRVGEPALDRQDQVVLQFLADAAAPSIALLRLYEDLQTSRTQILVAREEERKRLRHDLHDGVGPALSGLRLQIDTTRACLLEDSPAAAALLSTSERIRDVVDELRRITNGLAPGDLGRMGLAGALRELAARMEGQRLRITVDLEPDPLPPLPAAVEVAVYRISGEALNNILRHSGAASAHLVVRVDDGRITVETRDDGAGFPTHRTSTGVGLRSMAERAEELGGTLTTANDTRGAVVRAVLPCGVPRTTRRDEDGTADSCVRDVGHLRLGDRSESEDPHRERTCDDREAQRVHDRTDRTAEAEQHIGGHGAEHGNALRADEEVG